MSENKDFKNPFEDEFDEQQIINIEHHSTAVEIPIQAELKNKLKNPQTILQQTTQTNQPQTNFNAEETIFINKSQSFTVQKLNENGDPPLLQDLGIDPDKIGERILLIAKAENPSMEVIEEPDLTGPILIAVILGILLLLAGKSHFGDIYVMFIVGNILSYLIFNFMSQADVIPLYSIMSTLGYGLLPMLVLGLFGIVFSLKSTLGILLSLGISVWSSVSASKFMECLMKINIESNKRLLIMYPLFLFYVSFAIIVIF